MKYRPRGSQGLPPSRSAGYMRAYREKNPRDYDGERAGKNRHYNRRRALINELKDIPCTDCGIKYPPCVMDFDHVRGQKLFGIATNYGVSLKRLMIEVKKCDVVCANCHRLRTHN